LPFEEYTFCDGYTLGHTLLFVGTLNYMPNVEGLEWFINSVFIPFREKFQDAGLLVVGRNPKETILKLCETEGVELHADVPDVRPYYARSRAVVVPLLNGGGTRIKILEATLANRPVLSTPIGAEGLNFVDGLDILLFNNSDSFISQYLLLQKMDFYDGMARMAKERTQLEYSPQKFKESINKVLEN
jgi:glycosyltransferase involved in cell wall biosynthesis